ncbi:transcriptional initiation protein Tat [Chitinophaga alhagiae]|uniref:Transcriptional initiation protein Tat n=1 Tax=Chitinophaga alhagiae TaxID=2203219 RepID=A0ABM6W8W9_9BACT|nr:gluconate 2-dehydrogenase subunit 3 family protein [Chitinophaga alhagiae]AWO00339.1 transcriptional initiation protein Tat [Chitinophaga alhagiae]
MDRRESLKILGIGSLQASLLLAGCSGRSGSAGQKAMPVELYGRTAQEAAYDASLHAETFFTAHERKTLAGICDWIIPADGETGGATAAGVVDFIEFIVKDQPPLQLPLRGGLGWMDITSRELYGRSFIAATRNEQAALLDKIAYPGKVEKDFLAGAGFFNQVRNLCTTGYFTSKIGLKDLGYMGNTPNAWDGAPEEVLKEYDVAYDPRYLHLYVRPEDRGTLMTWDDHQG